MDLDSKLDSIVRILAKLALQNNYNLIIASYNMELILLYNTHVLFFNGYGSFRKDYTFSSDQLKTGNRF